MMRISAFVRQTLILSLLLPASFARAGGDCVINALDDELRAARMAKIPVINPSVFREYDIRGVAGQELSADFAHRLGRGFAEYMVGRTPAAGRKRLTIAVGRDARLSSPEYRDALIRGLRESGIDVIDIGLVTTPMTYYSTHAMDLDGAIMVTASHNPGKYNGFKITLGRDPIFGPEIQKLREIMEKQSGPLLPKEETGHLSHENLIPQFQDFVNRRLKLNHSEAMGTIVLDCANGTAGKVAPGLYRKMGLSKSQVVSIFEDPDGNFPNHNPDPSVPANMKALQEEVVRKHAAVGIAFDGDSDRIGVVDDKGRIVSPDALGALLASDYLKTHPGAKVMSEVKMGQSFYDTVKKLGGVPVMHRTGAAVMKDTMKKDGIGLAIETSGHIVYGPQAGGIGSDDAPWVGARLLKIISERRRPLSEILAPFISKTVSTPEMRVEVPEAKKFALVEKTKESLAAKNYKIIGIDGVRIELPNGSWGLVRASNTEPALSIRFEAGNQKDLEAVRQLMEGALSNVAAELGMAPIRLEGGHH